MYPSLKRGTEIVLTIIADVFAEYSREVSEVYPEQEILSLAGTQEKDCRNASRFGQGC